MHIGILMANTDDSDFSQSHPLDGEKFARMFRSVRPDWSVTVFSVKDGIFPADDDRFDGWLITGSPASVNDSAPWVADLLRLIQGLSARGEPLFGACFGHQAIAKALGGTVGDNPGGWILGRTTTVLEGQEISLYAAHREQVTALPPGAAVAGGNAECPVGAMKIGDRILTTQYHPEMTHDFVQALTDELAEKLPPNVIDRARQSLEQPADSLHIAERIAQFFERARH